MARNKQGWLAPVKCRRGCLLCTESLFIKLQYSILFTKKGGALPLLLGKIGAILTGRIIFPNMTRDETSNRTLSRARLKPLALANSALCGTCSPHQQLYQETFITISSAV